MKKYYSKHDKEFCLIFFMIVAIPCLILPVLFPRFFIPMLFVDILIILYSSTIWYTVWYSFSNEGVVISMLRRKNTLLYKDISNIQNYTGGGRPCLGFSKDRIKISFKNGDYLYISPLHREEVYAKLKMECQ